MLAFVMLNWKQMLWHFTKKNILCKYLPWKNTFLGWNIFPSYKKNNFCKFIEEIDDFYGGWSISREWKGELLMSLLIFRFGDCFSLFFVMWIEWKSFWVSHYDDWRWCGNIMRGWVMMVWRPKQITRRGGNILDSFCLLFV